MTEKMAETSMPNPRRENLDFIKITKIPDYLIQVVNVNSSNAPKLHFLDLYRDYTIQNQGERTQALCFVSCRYEDVRILESDHIQPATDILRRQAILLSAMNTVSEFAVEILKVSGMDRYFCYDKTAQKYYGTELFYTEYYNDVSNIWLIHRIENQEKSNQDLLSWFKNQKAYGPEFITRLGQLDTSGILYKAENGCSLTEAAVNWLIGTNTLLIQRSRSVSKATSACYRRSQELSRLPGTSITKDGKRKRKREHEGFMAGSEMVTTLLSGKTGLSPHTSEESASNDSEKTRNTKQEKRKKRKTAVEKVVAELPSIMNRLVDEHM